MEQCPPYVVESRSADEEVPRIVMEAEYKLPSS
jgi:hypothetical protein